MAAGTRLAGDRPHAYRFDELGSLQFERLCAAILPLDAVAWSEPAFGRAGILPAGLRPPGELSRLPGPTLVIVAWLPPGRARRKTAPAPRGARAGTHSGRAARLDPPPHERRGGALLLSLLDAPPPPVPERELGAAVRRHFEQGFAQTLTELVDRLSDHFPRRVPPASVAWVHPSWRDLVITQLAGDAAVRSRFLERCDPTGSSSRFPSVAVLPASGSFRCCVTMATGIRRRRESTSSPAGSTRPTRFACSSRSSRRWSSSWTRASAPS